MLPRETIITGKILKAIAQGSPGGSEVKNLPVNAGDTGLTPDQG